MEWLKKIPFGAVMQFSMSVAGAMALGYTLLVPFVKPLAAEAFVEMLKQQGVDPEVFKEMHEQSQSVEEDIEQLKKKLGDVGNTLTIHTEQNRRIENLVEKLLTIQLNKRADFTESPPGSGPKSPLNLQPTGAP